MKWGRIIGFGALLWILIFFEVSILMFAFGLSGMIYSIVHYILSAILALIVALFYFRGLNKKDTGFVNGLLLGLYFVIVGIILDAIITVPLFVKDYTFFLNWNLLISYFIGIIVVTLVSITRKH